MAVYTVFGGRRVVANGIMAKTSPMQFAREVRQEVAKVTWPSRSETGVTTALVFVMVFLAAAFFFVADQVLGKIVQLLLSVGV
jgi:preprotein translocase subunit SecE